MKAMYQSIRVQVENQAKPDSREDVLRIWIEQNRRTNIRKKIERDCNVATESFLRVGYEGGLVGRISSRKLSIISSFESTFVV